MNKVENLNAMNEGMEAIVTLCNSLADSMANKGIPRKTTLTMVIKVLIDLYEEEKREGE